MKIKGIAADTLALLLMLGKEADPNEFAAMLREEDGVLRDVDLIPGTIGGRDSASVICDMIPLNIGYAGSAHSHPNGVIRASEADISFFSRTGSCHIIIGHPYEENCWGCFRSDGTPVQLEVIHDPAG
ncbi:MAG TPA: Mov34/MPN/PAD-1 family protein [Methanospirillum sp.]|nr:Mov34/MPN/PAD-1 family protein [Methanospirillum sp.]